MTRTIMRTMTAIIALLAVVPSLRAQDMTRGVDLTTPAYTEAEMTRAQIVAIDAPPFAVRPAREMIAVVQHDRRVERSVVLSKGPYITLDITVMLRFPIWGRRKRA